MPNRIIYQHCGEVRVSFLANRTRSDVINQGLVLRYTQPSAAQLDTETLIDRHPLGVASRKDYAYSSTFICSLSQFDFDMINYAREMLRINLFRATALPRALFTTSGNSRSVKGAKSYKMKNNFSLADRQHCACNCVRRRSTPDS